MNCPACFREIKATEFIEGHAYCSCGKSIHLKPTDRRGEHVNVILPLVVLTLTVLASAIHIVNWNEHSVAIIPLKLKQMTGMANTEDLQSIASICQNRNKANCESLALEQAFKKDSQLNSLLVRVGEIKMKQKDYREALRVYTTYFKEKGQSLEARHQMALALTKTGQLKQAKKQYRYLVKAHSHTPNFKVARDYVGLLMETKKYARARKVILKHRRVSPEASLFLEKQWKFINKKIRARKMRKTPKRAELRGLRRVASDTL